jgi:hypothetical protein
MVKKDALFFFECILPMHKIKKSGIPGDSRMSFFADVASYSNLYAVKALEWGDYDNVFKPICAKELVKLATRMTTSTATGMKV